MEVMVAVAILGLVVTSVMYVFSNSLKGIGKAELYTEGVMVAREAMERILLRPTLEEGTYEGVVRDNFQWTVQVMPRETAVEAFNAEFTEGSGGAMPLDWLQEDTLVRLYEITVTVIWPDSGYPGRVQFSTLSTRVEIPDVLEVVS